MDKVIAATAVGVLERVAPISEAELMTRFSVQTKRIATTITTTKTMFIVLPIRPSEKAFGDLEACIQVKH